MTKFIWELFKVAGCGAIAVADVLHFKPDLLSQAMGLLSDRVAPQSQLELAPPDRQVVLKSIQNVAELSVVVHRLEATLPGEVVNEILGVQIGSASLTYAAAAEVSAGINLDALTEDRITITESGNIRVQLPPVSILNVILLPDESQVIGAEARWFAPQQQQAELLQSVQIDALERLKANACENGIVTQAEAQAVAVIQNLLQTQYPRRVEVTIDPSTACASNSDSETPDVQAGKEVGDSLTFDPSDAGEAPEIEGDTPLSTQTIGNGLKVNP